MSRSYGSAPREIGELLKISEGNARSHSGQLKHTIRYGLKWTLLPYLHPETLRYHKNRCLKICFLAHRDENHNINMPFKLSKTDTAAILFSFIFETESEHFNPCINSNSITQFLHLRIEQITYKNTERSDLYHQNRTTHHPKTRSYHEAFHFN